MIFFYVIEPALLVLFDAIGRLPGWGELRTAVAERRKDREGEKVFFREARRLGWRIRKY